MAEKYSRQDRGKFDDTMAAMFSNVEYRGNYLFYAHMIGQCSVRIREDLEAPAGVCFTLDHYTLFINPKYFDGFSLKNRLCILKHEMLHILNGHVDRGEGLNHEPWNYATDCSINQLCDPAHLPECAVTPKTLGEGLGIKVPEHRGSEEYYNIIKKYIKDKPQQQQAGEGQPGDGKDQNDGSGSGNKMDDHGTWKESTGDKDLQQDLTKKMIEKSQNETLKGKGTIPNECSHWMELHTRKCEVNWKRVLRGIVGNKRVGKRSTIMKNDRRFPKREDLRGKTKDRMFNLLVIADVSGSMSNEDVTTTLAEVRHICDVTKTDVDLIQIDTQAYTPEKLSKKTKVITRKGNGGTTLHPALDMAQKHGIDYQALVVLTDGGLFGDDITYFENLNKKVIWLVSKTGHVMNEMKEGRMQAFQLTGE